jgi:curved DNA-binding protein CbpA
MTAYFANCHTSDEIKAEYRRLAKANHPDLGGDTATMQQINAAYAYHMAQVTRREKPGKSEQEYSDLATVHEAIRQAIEAIINLAGLDIEICSLWVWVSGNTRTHKEALKASGYRWAPKKERWYFAGVPANGRGRASMDEIRDRYGSQHVAGRRQDDDWRPHFAGSLA